MREAILAVVPPNRTELVRNTFGHLNDLSYKDRLHKLLERFPTLASDVIGGGDQQARFCRLVRDLRDAEAHALDRNEKIRVGGKALVGIAAKLRVILDAWLLAEVGLSDGQIEEAMRKNRRFWYYASCESWPWGAF